MSRIHDALVKAEQERNGGQVASAAILPVQVPGVKLLREGSAPASAAEAITRVGIVIPPPPSPYLRFDSLVAHCAHPEWHPEPNANIFLTSAPGAPGAEQIRTRRS